MWRFVKYMVNAVDNPSPPSAHRDVYAEIKEGLERLSESQFKRFLIMLEEQGLLVYERGKWRAPNGKALH